MSTKTYSEALRFSSFEERFNFLKLDGRSSVGDATFGGYRYLNQAFYRSKEWRRFRNEMIVRDNGCDLAILDRHIYGKVILHHINPITIDDAKFSTDLLMDPENVICVSTDTHRALHFSDLGILMPSDCISRKPNDTCPWKEAL